MRILKIFTYIENIIAELEKTQRTVSGIADSVSISAVRIRDLQIQLNATQKCNEGLKKRIQELENESPNIIEGKKRCSELVSRLRTNASE